MQRNFLLEDNPSFHIALYQPQIPPNTGNIARLCVATGSHLHIIRPTGFSLSDKRLKRAGLDYWKYLKLTVHDSLEDFLKFVNGRTMYLASTKAHFTIFDKSYAKGDIFLFGSETEGLPEWLLLKYSQQCINIPMKPQVRSLNLSDSVSIVVYEAIRQVVFG